MNTPQATSAASSRRALIAGVGGLAALSMMRAAAPARAVDPALTFAQIPGTGDIKVLNYALALEALEADLYRQALERLTALGLGTGEPDVRYLTEVGRVEREHRDFLNAALGDSSIIGTNTQFGILRNATFSFSAGGIPLAQASRQQVLDLILTAEATGVGAYLGAIPSFQPQSQYLQLAASIQGTEARHTTLVTIIRNQLFGMSSPVAPLVGDTSTGEYDNTRPSFGTTDGRDVPIAPDTVLARVSPFIVLPG